MNILVTGASGQLGSAFRKISKGYDENCFFTSRTGDGSISALDVADAEAVIDFVKAHNVDIIINCAGYTDVNRAESERDAAVLLNVTAPEILAAAAKETGALLIHFSTDYVYDGESNTPYQETSQTAPLNFYGKTKLDGDKAVVASGCRYMIFRISWMYSVYGKDFFKTIERKTSELPSINVVSDQIGTPTYANDLADAIFWIITNGLLDKTGIYNYSNEGVCSWYDFAHAIDRKCGNLCEVRPCSSADFPSPVSRPKYSVLDKSLFKKTFGYEIPHWEDSLELCVREYCQ